MASQHLTATIDNTLTCHSPVCARDFPFDEPHNIYVDGLWWCALCGSALTCPTCGVTLGTERRTDADARCQNSQLTMPPQPSTDPDYIPF